MGLYRTLGEVFRRHCGGWNVCVFTGNATLARHIGIEPSRQLPLFNGKIPCRLLTFDVS
jgi:23S rRNA G2445 N2-methylase RlmL